MDTLADVALGLGHWPVPRVHSPPLSRTLRPLAHTTTLPSSVSPSTKPSSLSTSYIYSRPLSHEGDYPALPRLRHTSVDDRMILNAFTTPLSHAPPGSDSSSASTTSQDCMSASSLSPTTRERRTRVPSVMDMNFLVNDADIEADGRTSPRSCRFDVGESLQHVPHDQDAFAPTLATPSPEPPVWTTAASPAYIERLSSLSPQPSGQIQMVTTLAGSAEVCRKVSRERRRVPDQARTAQHAVPVSQASSASFKTRSRQPAKRTRPNRPAAIITTVDPAPPANTLAFLTPAASPRDKGPSNDVPASDSSAPGESAAAPALGARKRSRITPKQLGVLNTVFAHTFFPATEIRLAIARETGLSPRTVQVWFQNRRQQWRARNGAPRAVPGDSPVDAGSGGAPSTGDDDANADGAPPSPQVKRVMVKATRGRPRLEDVPSSRAASVASQAPAADACARCSPPPATGAAMAFLPSAPPCTCTATTPPYPAAHPRQQQPQYTAFYLMHAAPVAVGPLSGGGPGRPPFVEYTPPSTPRAADANCDAAAHHHADQHYHRHQAERLHH